MTRKPELKIIPVNEPNGFGNGWDECPEDQATGFEIDDGTQVVDFYSTRAAGRKSYRLTDERRDRIDEKQSHTRRYRNAS